MNFESHVVPVACIAMEKLCAKGVVIKALLEACMFCCPFFLLFALSFPCNLVLKINGIMLCVMALLY